MTRMTFVLLALMTGLNGAAVRGEGKYPPFSEYLMPREAEITLAKAAAPAGISNRATIKVLTKSGYEVAHEGENGVVCMVMRGFSAPTYSPAHFRDLVCEPSWRWPERRPTRSPKAFRRHTSEASSRSGTR